MTEDTEGAMSHCQQCHALHWEGGKVAGGTYEED